MTIKSFLGIGLLSLVVVGCYNTKPEYEIERIEPEVKTTKVYAVVVGMETSRFAGSCPGAGLDAERMKKLLSTYTPNITYLRDSSATKARVSVALQEAVTKAGTGLVIFYYSGHGGSEPFPNTGIEEEDGQDEFYCLYDTYMRDNDMWKIISKSKGRVLLINDCCHSSTIFRSPSLRMSPPLSWDKTIEEENGFSMLCWSGCPDDTYSYGAATGGQFTNALLRHFKDTMTYEELWNKIKNDRTLRAYENPQSTVIGSGFDSMMVFR